MKTLPWFLTLAFIPFACGPGEQPLFVAATGSPIAVAGGPGNVVLGDVNGDGKLDMVVASGQARAITVLLGQGDGQFRAAGGSPLTVPDPPSEMALGDINGDRKLDVALASHDSYGVMLLLGDGAGGFGLASNSPFRMRDGQHPHTHGLEIGDLNGDGKLDLATVNSDDNDVSVAFGDGRGGFTRAPASFPVGESPYPATLGDLNGDGHLDIVANSVGRRTPQQLESSRALTVLLNSGRGDFRRSQVALQTPLPWFAAIGDLNGDRKPDLAVTHAERNELTILVGDGEGRFTEVAGSPFDLGHAAWRADIVDANGDGKADVVAAAGDGVRVMLGDGKGDFKPAPGSPFRTGGKGIWRLAVGDPDIVTSNLESNSVGVLLGR
jgi:hypothetical protein